MTTSAPANLDDPPEDAPRFLRAFWRLVRWAMPARFRFFGLYEYRIAQVYTFGPVVDLQATEDTTAVGLDDIPKVPAWPGISGVATGPTAGSRVLVQFINGNAGRPVVVAWAPSGDSGWIPPGGVTIDTTGALALGPSASAVVLAGGSVPDPGGGTGRVVRYGDPILFAPPGQGTILPGSVLTNFSKVHA